MNISKPAFVNKLLDEYTASLDALPFKIAHHFSDLRELDAVLGGSIASLNKKMHFLLNALEDQSYTTRERFLLLRDVADDAAKLKMGNEDKIRLAAAAVEELKQHSTHASHLLAVAHALNPVIPPHLPAPSAFPHVAPLTASYIPRPPPDEKRKSHKRGAGKSRNEGDDEYMTGLGGGGGGGGGEGRTPKRRKRVEGEEGAREGRERRERKAAAASALEKAALGDVDMDGVGEEEEKVVVRPRRERKQRVSPTTIATSSAPLASTPAPAPDPPTLPAPATAAKAETLDNVSAADGEGAEAEDDGEEDSQRYCFCGGVSYGEMIGCDDSQCEHQWFHLECLGMERPPLDAWYCDECIARRPARKEKKAARGRGRGRARGGK